MSPTSSVLLAPDKFKGCLTAMEVGTELQTGLANASAAIEVTLHPIADGGDGTLAAALATGFTARTVAVSGPLGEPHTARIGIRGSTALIELAEVCGLERLPGGRMRPMETTTYGVGQAIRAAIGFGCRQLLVGVGGSASTDGGMGAAAALGARIWAASGAPVRACGAGLGDVSTVDFAKMLTVLDGIDLTVATDVSAPLTGIAGAAHVFAPQKGATADQVAVLDAGLNRWADVLQEVTGADVARLPGAGAAGGFAAPFLATATARIASGAELVLDLTGTRRAIAAADVVVTGEGRWDAQTKTGKAPSAVVHAARSAGKQVIAVAGSFSPDADLTAMAASYSLTEIAVPDRDPLLDARILLREIGARIGHRLL